LASQEIFPLNNTQDVQYDTLNELTHEIMADSINILITVWLSVMED